VEESRQFRRRRARYEFDDGPLYRDLGPPFDHTAQSPATAGRRQLTRNLRSRGFRRITGDFQTNRPADILVGSFFVRDAPERFACCCEHTTSSTVVIIRTPRPRSFRVQRAVNGNETARRLFVFSTSAV